MIRLFLVKIEFINHNSELSMSDVSLQMENFAMHFCIVKTQVIENSSCNISIKQILMIIAMKYAKTLAVKVLKIK